MGGPRQKVGLPFRSLHVCFLGSWMGWVGPIQLPSLGWVGRGQGAGHPLDVLGRMGGLRPAPVGLRSCFLSGVLGRMGGPRRRGWVFVGLPSCFLFRLLGRMGGPRPRSWAPLGSLHTSFLVGPRPRSWAPINLPSCFLSGLLGPPSCFLLSGSWVGRVGRGKEAELPFSSLHISFLGSWVGWVGRGQEAGLPSSFLGSWVGWVVRAAKKLGSRWAPFIFFLGPGSDGRQKSWAPIELPSYFLSGLLGRMGVPLGSLHVSFFLGSWVGWVGRSKEAGLPLGSLHLGSGWAPLHVSFFLGPGSDGRQRSFAPIALPSYFLSGLLSRMGGLRPRLGFRWAPFMFPSFWAPGSDGWAAAKEDVFFFLLGAL